jgi:hypothetical protein
VTSNQLVRYVSANVRTFGIGRSVQDVVYHGIRKALDVRILKGMTAELPDVNPSLFSPGRFTARFATADDLDAAFAAPEWRNEFSAEWIAAVLAKGDECFAIFDGPVLASVGWYATSPTPVTRDLAMHFDPAWVYMHRGYTAEAYRGLRLHAIGMCLALREYVRRGACGLISFVELDNLRSLQSVERMGYRAFGSICVTTAGGKERAWASPGCRRFRFRLAPIDSRRSA